MNEPAHPDDAHPDDGQPAAAHPDDGQPHDVLSSDAFAAGPPPTLPTKRRPHGKAIVAVLASTALLLTAGAAYAGVQVMSGGGTQPEDVLPANTVAFVKIDLDPAAGQKIAVARLVDKFPKIKGADGRTVDEGNVKDALLASLFSGTSDTSYARDIKPWIGDRAAVAAVPSTSSPNGVAPVLAVAFTDESKMSAALTKAKAKKTASGEPARTHFAVRDGYVIISDSQAVADRVAHDTTKLSANPVAASDAKSLNGDQIAIAWADLGAVYKLVPKDKKAGVAAQFGAVKPAGRVVVGVHAGSNYVEVKGRSHGLQVTAAKARLGATPGTGLVQSFPADVLGAGSVTGMGAFLTDSWTEYAKHDTLNIGPQATSAGLRIPADFAALFGTETAFAANADQHFGVRVLTSDPARAKTLLALTDGLSTRHATALDVPGGYVASDDATFAEALRAGGGTLGDSAQFKLAVPDADKAGVLVYLDLAKALAATGDSTMQRDWATAGSLGLTATGGSDQTMTLRLTTR